MPLVRTQDVWIGTKRAVRPFFYAKKKEEAFASSWAGEGFLPFLKPPFLGGWIRILAPNLSDARTVQPMREKVLVS